MKLSEIYTALNTSMQISPFPFFWLYVIGIGMLWLLLEYLLTRLGRSTSGWQRPIPGLPLASEVTVWIVRGSSWMLWIWASLYFLLVIAIYISRDRFDFRMMDGMLYVTGFYRRVYESVVGLVTGLVDLGLKQ